MALPSIEIDGSVLDVVVVPSSSLKVDDLGKTVTAKTVTATSSSFVEPGGLRITFRCGTHSLCKLRLRLWGWGAIRLRGGCPCRGRGSPMAEYGLAEAVKSSQLARTQGPQLPRPLELR